MVSLDCTFFDNVDKIIFIIAQANLLFSLQYSITITRFKCIDPTNAFDQQNITKNEEGIPINIDRMR